MASLFFPFDKTKRKGRGRNYKSNLGAMSTIQVLLSPALVSMLLHASEAEAEAEACVTERKWTATVGCRLQWTPLLRAYVRMN